MRPFSLATGTRGWAVGLEATVAHDVRVKGENPGTVGSGFRLEVWDPRNEEPKLRAFTFLFGSATRGSEAVGFSAVMS